MQMNQWFGKETFVSYKDQVQRSLDTSPGFLIRAAGMPHRTVLPNWEHETQVRIFPQPHTDGGFKCMREGSDDNNFSDTVWSEPIARCLGVQEQFTYIDRIPGVTGKTPTSRLVEALYTLIDEKPRDVPESWVSWIKGSKKRAAKLQKTKRGIFWQGMEIMRKGKMLTNASGQVQPQFPVLIMGAVSLQMSFEEMSNTRVSGFQGPMPETIEGDDAASRAQRDLLYAQMFAIGDWCSIDHGRVMSIFQAEASGKFTMNHYSLKMLQELPLQSIAPMVQQQWTPWEKLLRYFSVEEHVQMLCRAFPPEAVDYVFGQSELRDLLPDTFKDSWKRYQASQLAWSQGMPQQPPQPPQPPQAPPPQLPAGAPVTQVQTAPPAPPVAPPPVPPTTAAAPQPPTLGGAAVDLSGATVEAPQTAPPQIMGAEGFSAPAEFTMPQGPAGTSTGPAAPVATPPLAPAATPEVQTTPGTPAAAENVVDQEALQRALGNLKSQRDQSAQGNS